MTRVHATWKTKPSEFEQKSNMEAESDDEDADFDRDEERNGMDVDADGSDSGAPTRRTARLFLLLCSLSVEAHFSLSPHTLKIPDVQPT